MSTITGFETEVPAPPLPRRPRGLLVDALLPLTVSTDNPTDPGSRADPDPMSRIEAGVIFCGLGCVPVSAWQDDVCAAVDATLDDPADADGQLFDSFLVSADETSPIRFYDEWIRERLNARLRVGLSPQLALELQQGALTGNPSLQSAASHVVAGAPTPVAEVMFVLEDIMAGFEARQFYLHMDPATFTELDRVNDFDDVPGGPIHTATGHRIIADPGYDGTEGPDDPDGGGQVATAAAGRWIYASLPIMGWVGATRQLGTGTGFLDVTTNKRTDALVQPALLAFDPCVVVAVQTVVPTYTVDTV